MPASPSSQAPESPTPWRVLRWVVGLQFMAAGSFSALQWQATVDFNALLTGPGLAPVATALQVALALGGGVSLVANLRPRLGASLLLAFLVPATVRHGFAAHEATHLVQSAGGAAGDAVERLGALARRGQLASIAKNIGLVGVVLFIAMRGSAAPAQGAAEHDPLD